MRTTMRLRIPLSSSDATPVVVSAPKKSRTWDAAWNASAAEPAQTADAVAVQTICDLISFNYLLVIMKSDRNLMSDSGMHYQTDRGIKFDRITILLVKGGHSEARVYLYNLFVSNGIFFVFLRVLTSILFSTLLVGLNGPLSIIITHCSWWVSISKDIAGPSV